MARVCPCHSLALLVHETAADEGCCKLSPRLVLGRLPGTTGPTHRGPTQVMPQQAIELSSRYTAARTSLRALVLLSYKS
eukprot:349634-Chlamydomonas_euryale.AAC.16